MTLLESDPATRHKGFLETLRAYLRPEAVITDPTALRTYECDGLTGFRVVPTAVVLADSTEDVRRAVAACRVRCALRRPRSLPGASRVERCRQWTASSFLFSGCDGLSESIPTT